MASYNPSQNGNGDYNVYFPVQQFTRNGIYPGKIKSYIPAKLDLRPNVPKMDSNMNDILQRERTERNTGPISLKHDVMKCVANTEIGARNEVNNKCFDMTGYVKTTNGKLNINGL